MFHWMPFSGLPSIFAGQDLCHWYSGACPKHSRCKQYGNMFRCECDQGYSKNEWNECEGMVALVMMIELFLAETERQRGAEGGGERVE